jgi:ABC-2 type transport system permease protein
MPVTLMFRSVFTKAIWDHRRSTVWWMIGSAALITWVSLMYPVLRDSQEIKGFIDDLPSGMLAVLGIDTAVYLTGAGFLQAQFYSLFGPLMIIGLAISLAASATAREEKNGTMDVLLSVPLSRSSLIVQKASMVVALVAVVVMTMVFTLLILNVALDLGLSVEGVIAVNLSVALLGLVFGGVALVVGAFSGKPSSATGVGVFAAVVAWFVNAFAGLFDWLEVPAKLSPFSWYLDGGPLINGWTTGQIWLVATITVLLLGSIGLFSRRNIATSTSIDHRFLIGRSTTSVTRPRQAWLLGSVVGQAIWEKRRSVWMWAIGLATLMLLTFAAWPTFAKDSAAISEMISAMPKELFAMFGMTDPDSLGTPAGFISSRTYQSVGPIVMIVFAIGSVSSLVMREESNGIFDMVLSTPVSRVRLLVGKATAIASLAFLIGLVLTLVGFAGNAIWDTGLNAANILAANIGLSLLALCFGGITLAVWSLLGSGPAVGVTAAIAATAWFLNGFGAIIDGLAPLRALSPFYWYLGDTAPLAKNFDPLYLLLLLVAVAGISFATWRFRSRNIAV